MKMLLLSKPKLICPNKSLKKGEKRKGKPVCWGI
jgi:hypothetical protein